MVRHAYDAYTHSSGPTVVGQCNFQGTGQQGAGWSPGEGAATPLPIYQRTSPSRSEFGGQCADPAETMRQPRHICPNRFQALSNTVPHMYRDAPPPHCARRAPVVAHGSYAAANVGAMRARRWDLPTAGVFGAPYCGGNRACHLAHGCGSARLHTRASAKPMGKSVCAAPRPTRCRLASPFCVACVATSNAASPIAPTMSGNMRGARQSTAACGELPITAVRARPATSAPLITYA